MRSPDWPAVLRAHVRCVSIGHHRRALMCRRPHRQPSASLRAAWGWRSATRRPVRAQRVTTKVCDVLEFKWGRTDEYVTLRDPARLQALSRRRAWRNVCADQALCSIRYMSNLSGRCSPVARRSALVSAKLAVHLLGWGHDPGLGRLTQQFADDDATQRAQRGDQHQV